MTLSSCQDVANIIRRKQAQVFMLTLSRYSGFFFLCLYPPHPFPIFLPLFLLPFNSVFFLCSTCLCETQNLSVSVSGVLGLQATCSWSRVGFVVVFSRNSSVCSYNLEPVLAPAVLLWASRSSAAGTVSLVHCSPRFPTSWTKQLLFSIYEQPEECLCGPCKSIY